MRYADYAETDRLNLASLFGAGSTTVLAITALVAIMAPPVVSMMMGA